MAEGAPLTNKCTTPGGLKESVATTPDLSSWDWYSKRFRMVRMAIWADFWLGSLRGKATKLRSCVTVTPQEVEFSNFKEANARVTSIMTRFAHAWDDLHSIL